MSPRVPSPEFVDPFEAGPRPDASALDRLDLARPRRLLLRIAFAAFLVELLIMLVVAQIKGISGSASLLDAILDAGLLSLGLSPLLYLWLYRPLLCEVRLRRQAEGRLKEVNERLGAQVTKRTKSLRAAMTSDRLKALRLETTEAQLSKLSRAVDQSTSVVIITNLQGVIEYVNPSFSRVTGYEADEAIGNTPRMLSSGLQSPEFYKTMWETILAGEVWRGEVCNRKKNGQLYWDTGTITPVRNAANEISHFIAVKEDVTHERELHERLQQAQRLEALGKLVGGIAHDFNNMLCVINGQSQLAIAQTNAEHPCQRRLEVILSAGKRSADLTQQLLAFSRRQVLESEVVSVDRLLAGLEELLRRTINENITLVLRCEEETSLQVEIDPSQLEQVLVNLVINAQDAMPQGGSLTIEARAVSLDAETAALCELAAGSHVEILVIDTGEGIEPHTLPRIFDPYFTTKALGKGTGLGLASAHGFVKQSRGHIAAVSAVGKGTTFRLLLPIAPLLPLATAAIVE